MNGGEDWTLGDIVPNANWIEMSDTIQTFTTAGKADVAYWYVTEATAGLLDIASGWYDTADDLFATSMNKTPIPFTSGYVAKSGATGAALTFSGAVKDSVTEIPVGSFAITANVTPVDLTLGKITPNANWIEMSDTLQTFTTDGKADVAYWYVTEATAELLDIASGWYDTADDLFATPMNATPIPAGSGFVAKSGATGATLALPNPLAE